MKMRSRESGTAESGALHRIIQVLITCVALCMLLTLQAQAKHLPVLEPGTTTYVRKNNRKQVIIYVGDSRAMYMTMGHGNVKQVRNFAFAYVNGGSITVIGKNGMLKPYLEKLIRKYRRRNPVVVFNLGLNGNGIPSSNAKRIIRVYRRWMKEYPDIRFVVESVNPTLLTGGPFSDQRVVQLNALLQEEFEPDGLWMDTYSFINERHLIRPDGFGMKDVDDMYHYNWKTSAKILTRVRKWVEKNMAS